MPDSAPLERIGQTLKRARAQQGEDLRNIAAALNIRYGQLDAIETGNYDNLPGPTYAVGFIRSYAQYLGLDGEAAVRRFKQEIEGVENAPMLAFPTPAPEGRIPGGAIILVSALLIAVAYGAWYSLSDRDESVVSMIQGVPDRLQSFLDPTSHETAERPVSQLAPDADLPVDRGVVAGVTPPSPESEASLSQQEETLAPEPAVPAIDPAPSQSAAVPGNSSTAADEQVPETAVPPPPAAANAAADTRAAASDDETSVQSARPPAEASAAAPAVPTTIISGAGTRTTTEAIPAAPANPFSPTLSAPQPQVFGEENVGSRVVLRATQDSWVQVRDASSEIILARILRVGDSYLVPDDPGLTLLTGNAGGLQIVVDGRVLPPLGPAGTVRRDVPLNPTELLDGYPSR